MIIANLDPLETMMVANTPQLTGGALAISGFSAIALGHSSFTETTLKNLARFAPSDSDAYSSVQVVAIAAGGNAFASASAFSWSQG